MRVVSLVPACSLAVTALVLASPVLGGGSADQAAPAAAPRPATKGVPCHSVYVISNGATPDAPLSVLVNDAVVGVYDGYGAPHLDEQLSPGANVVAFSYAAMPQGTPWAELTCKSANGNSRVILSFRPTPKRLHAEMAVDFTGRS